MARLKRPPKVNPKNLAQGLPSLYRKVGALKVDEEHPRASFRRMVKILRAWAAEEFPDSDFYGEVVVRAENSSRSRLVQKLLRKKRRESEAVPAGLDMPNALQLDTPDDQNSY
mmetsp:Transcript_13768/g.55282  ORF Transcript_13768/g.55282 Transcript_13768/m.55282 type:complete len:113 (+) Transcript_13768:1136-1474(+)